MINSAEANTQTTAPGIKYWGGFFDELLSVDIAREVRRIKGQPNNIPPENIYFKPRVMIFNSRSSLVELVHSHFGGTLVQRQRVLWGNESNSNEWMLKKSSDIRDFLLLVEPHLHFKRPLVQKLLEYLQSKLQRIAEEKMVGSGHVMSKEERIEEESGFYEELKELKRDTSSEPFRIEAEGLAGRVDAVGSMQLKRSKRPERKAIGYEYGVRASLYSPHLGLLKFLEDTFGGYLALGEVKNSRGVYNQSYWDAGDNAAIGLIKEVFPYLILNRSLAEVILDFQAARSSLDLRKVTSGSEDKYLLEQNKLGFYLRTEPFR